MRDLHTGKLVPRARELRRDMTPAERKLWYDVLRAYPAKFRCQVPLLGYVLDFYVSSAKVCVEVDGYSHDGEAAQAYDAERTLVLEAAGIRVLRFTNAEVLGNLEGVGVQISAALR